MCRYEREVVRNWSLLFLMTILLILPATHARGQRTAKPVLHGRHWVAITGKPLGATAGAMIFQKGGNAVDAACAMLGATSTMFDVLSWGGETQALIYNPNTKKVHGINALGVAPTGATAEFFKDQGMPYPPAFGPLAAVRFDLRDYIYSFRPTRGGAPDADLESKLQNDVIATLGLEFSF